MNIKTKELKENSKGITLIALIVTIVILLILASISIAMLTGENGILKKASEAKEKSIIAEEKEKINLAKQAAFMQANYENRELTLNDIDEELKKDSFYGNSEITESNIIFETNRKNIYYIDNENIQHIGKEGNVGPVITNIELKSTSNTISVKTIALYATEEKDRKYTYYIAKEGETLKEITANTSGEYTFINLVANTKYRIKVKVETSKGTDEKEDTKVTGENTKPEISSVNLSEKTPTSLKIKMLATDADGDKLTYKLYLNNELKTTSEKTNSGSEVILEATKLSNYTTYNYYIEVDDGNDTAKSETKTAKTQCPGNTNYCSGGTVCYEGTSSYCSGGTWDNYSIACETPGCGYYIRNPGSFSLSDPCPRCGSTANHEYQCLKCGKFTTSPCHLTPCSHGYTYSHTVNHECSHGYIYSHTVNCSHNKSNSHYYCNHNNDGVAHD